MKKMRLFLTTLLTTFLLVSCSEGGGKPEPTPEETYTITWKNYDGTVLETDENIPKGTIPSYDGDKPERPSTERYSYTFSGWDGDIFQGITGNTIFIAQFLPAVNHYKVYFNTNGGKPDKIDPIEVEYASRMEEEKIPNNPTKEDKIWKYSFDGWVDEITSEPFDLTKNEVYGEIHLKATWKESKRKIYQATVQKDLTNNLTFEAPVAGGMVPLDNIDVEAGKEFRFSMIAKTSNIYLVPTSIHIYLWNKRVLVLHDDYEIIPSADKTMAEVIIKPGLIDTDLYIYGSAIYKESYDYEMIADCGLKEIPRGTQLKEDGDLTLTLEAIDGYALPSAENIYVQFDKVTEEEPVQWISPSETFETIDEYCTYDEGKGLLTIKSNHISAMVTIAARAKDYPLLDKLSWQQINYISSKGCAPYLFNLGEEKKVMVNGQIHRTRIIGFNQDIDPNGNLIGITFDFVNLISDENGYSLATYWQDQNDCPTSSFHYPDSSLRKALTGNGNGDFHWFQYFGSLEDTEEIGRNRFYTLDEKYAGRTVLNMLPNELVNVLKTARKYTLLHNNNTKLSEGYYYGTIDDKLFPLSAVEMGVKKGDEVVNVSNDGEIEPFKYSYFSDYGGGGDPKLYKCQVNTKDGYRNTELYGTDISGKYTKSKRVYAGYHYPNQPSSKYGTMLRTPNTWTGQGYNGHTWVLFQDGRISTFYPANTVAYGIAPGFCV